MDKQRKSMVGRVVSDKMDKTVVVVVETMKRHRLYGKTINSRKRYPVHDESGASHEGDLVRIEETRPLSASKRWVVAEVLDANPAQVATYVGGNEKVFGFFVGETMKRMAGKANPGVVNEILRRTLGKRKG